MNVPFPLLDNPPEFSFDGYLRLTFAALTRLAFINKLAWEDAELVHEFCAESIPARRAGYCEWDTGGKNPISIGWTWFEIADGNICISPCCVNSNLMLVTHKNYDVGASKTSELLRAWLSGVAWKPGSVLADSDLRPKERLV